MKAQEMSLPLALKMMFSDGGLSHYCISVGDATYVRDDMAERPEAELREIVSNPEIAKIIERNYATYSKQKERADNLKGEAVAAHREMVTRLKAMGGSCRTYEGEVLFLITDLGEGVIRRYTTEVSYDEHNYGETYWDSEDLDLDDYDNPSYLAEIPSLEECVEIGAKVAAYKESAERTKNLEISLKLEDLHQQIERLEQERKSLEASLPKEVRDWLYATRL